MNVHHTRNINSDLNIFHEAVKNAQDIIFFISEDGKIVEANARAVETYGYNYNELINMYIWELRNPNMFNRVIMQFNKALMEGAIFETIHYKKDGTFIPVEVSSVSIGNNGIVMSIVRDITWRIEKDQEIRRLAAIVENSRDAIIGINLEGIITSWNKGAEIIYGYDKSEAIGSSVTILAPAEKKEEVRENIEKAIKGEEINDFETTRRNKSDKKIYVSLTASTVKDNDENIVGVSIIARDITERKYKENELQEKYEELSQAYEEIYAAEEQLWQNCRELEELKKKAESANKAKSRFLANMSHEIRTPMNGIIGITELLSNTVLDQQQHDYIDILNTSSTSLMGIINDILDISKIESGKLKLNKETFNLRENIEKIIKEFLVTSQNKRIELMYFIDPLVDLNLTGDPLRLNQVLTNLVNNAIKFTERGHIYITVSKVMSKRGSIKLLFSVEDTGIGISDNVKDRLFKVFSPGDDSYTKKYGGTGLGLAISKDIVTKMNGEIWVVSKEGQGSTFYFTAEFSINNSIGDLYSGDGSPRP